MKHTFIFILFIMVGIVNAQNGDVDVIKDNRINALIEKQSTVIPPAVNPEIEGFRVQLFFDSDKTEINNARSKFITRFPKIDTYITYNAPNFFLKAGDFRTRLEAEKIKSEIEFDFPTSFVIKEKINLPRLEKEE